MYNPQKFASDFSTEKTVRVVQQNNFLRDYFWRFSSEKVTVWNTQLVSYDNLYSSVKEFLARISNLNTYQPMCKG